MSGFERPPPDCENMVSLKVDNLSYRTNTRDLLEEFSRFGEVGDVYIPKDRFTRESRGFAFVRFFERRDAEDAMDEMNGRMFDNRELRVQQAKYGRPSRPAPRGRNDRGGDRGHDSGSRRRRSRSRSRSPRRRKSPSRSPRRRSPSKSRSRSPRRSPAKKSRSRSPAKSPARSRSRDRD